MSLILIALIVVACGSEGTTAAPISKNSRQEHGLKYPSADAKSDPIPQPAPSTVAESPAPSTVAESPAATGPAATGPAATAPAVGRRAGDPKSPEEAEMMMVEHPATQPVPLLTADETIPTFNLPPGFRIEVVAEEPMVEHPVAMQFAPDGRLWVVEMRSYMPNIDAEGERKPNGRISVLEDIDGDGRMDKSTVFMDGLVLPRAVGLVREGALVGIPPNVWYARDTDSDGRSDERRSIAQDYGIRGNPEHQPNGLMYGLDNWIYSANYDTRFRWLDRQWATGEYEGAGQWGITQDDWGRLFTNNNSNYLRANLVPPHYLKRNPHFRPAGVNVEVDGDQTCWPAHASAVNRGYRPGVLRPDNYRLWKFTGACGPAIYRGGLFPPEFDGNFFTGEVTANFVRRSVLTESGGRISGNNAYEEQQDEFLTTTYERFRPVNCYTGPEGALYIVDMHHGLIQHNTYVTPYVRKQYAQRALDKFNGNTGRIYRVVRDAGPVPPGPNLAKASSAQLVGYLAHRNGWLRDTAQRLLVEKRDESIVADLRELAMNGDDTFGRLHALWALEGVGQLNPEVLGDALADPVGKIRANAIRLSEPFLPGDEPVLSDVLKLRSDDDYDVRLQFALSVSAVPAPAAQAALVDVVTASADDQFIRDAAISGMPSRELEFLERLLADPRWAEPAPGRDVMLAVLTRCVMADGDPQRVMQLTQLMAAQSEPSLLWRQWAMVDSFPKIDPRKPLRNAVKLSTRPASLDVLAASPDPNVREGTTRVAHVLMWPEKRVNSTTRRSMSETEQARFEAGRTVYATVCGQCHKPDGMGQAGLAPPLIDSDWVLGDPDRLIKIVLHGLRGPITVNDQVWDMDMPHLRTLSDEDIAAALTYIRREWEHDATPVTPEDVAEIRARYADRLEAWTASELSARTENAP
ncbi:MAG TPA: c-type cytochrome [Tepidisphaeraceae bacterium]|nr:c-type cytochrome [Tepidisphaeraceae bacterium]